jgi:multidrug resistance protein
MKPAAPGLATERSYPRAAARPEVEARTPPAPLDPSAVRAIIAGIMLAMFLSALEQTIIAPALPTIGVRLGDIENLSWVVGGYLLSATAVTPLFGKLSDIYGRRSILMTGVAIFIVGSIACALAPTLWTLAVARAIQGIGGGGILPIAQAIIADLVSPRERARYQTQSAAMFMMASIIGPVLGGFLTDRLHWSLIFWINVPMGALALVMTYRALERLPRNERPHRLDWAGVALMVGAALALMLAMAWGGVRYPWGSRPILLLLAGSAALWALFVWRLGNAPEPFIPPSVLREPVVAGCVTAGFFSIGTIIGLSLYLPLYLTLVLGASASMSGLVLIAFTVGTVTGSFAAGRALGRHTHYLRMPMAGLFVAILALAAMALGASSSIGRVAVLLFLCGGGIGPMYPMTTVLIQNAVLPHQFGVATGTLNFFRLLGGTIVVAGFGAIVLGTIDASGERTVIEQLSRGAVREGNLSDFAAAFAWVFAAAAACLVVALVALAFVEERPLRGPATTRARAVDEPRLAAE